MLDWMGKRGPKRGPLAVKALDLRLKGLTYAEIGRQLGVSRQRAQQMTSPPPPIRHMVVARANERCQMCGVMVGASGQVHHRGSDGLEPDEYNDEENLELLCLACHRAAHEPHVEFRAAEYCRCRDCRSRRRHISPAASEPGA